MEKLKVNKNVKEALDSILSRDRKEYPFEYILEVQATHKSWKGESWKYLKELSVAEMAQALYVGYELERTKEDVIKDVYILHSTYSPLSIYSQGYKDAVENVLYILGIEIEGIGKGDN